MSLLKPARKMRKATQEAYLRGIDEAVTYTLKQLYFICDLCPIYKDGCENCSNEECENKLKAYLVKGINDKECI